MARVKLPQLASGAPAQVTVAGVAQVEVRKLVEPARPVELRSTLVGDPFILDEAIVARQAYGLLVQKLGIEVAALQSGDLGADQRSAVPEILRTMLRPNLQLPVMPSNSVQVLRLLDGRHAFEIGGVGQRAVKVVISLLDDPDIHPRQTL